MTLRLYTLRATSYFLNVGVEEIESMKNVERIIIFFLLLLLAIPAYVQEYSVHKYYVEKTSQPWPSEQCNNSTRGKIVFTYHEEKGVRLKLNLAQIQTQ